MGERKKEIESRESYVFFPRAVVVTLESRSGFTCSVISVPRSLYDGGVLMKTRAIPFPLLFHFILLLFFHSIVAATVPLTCTFTSI